MTDPEATDAGPSDLTGWVVEIGYPAHNLDGQLPLLLATIVGEGGGAGSAAAHRPGAAAPRSWVRSGAPGWAWRASARGWMSRTDPC